MRLLVTGGAGFIGSTFVHRRLHQTDDDITVLDKLTYAGTWRTSTTSPPRPASGDRMRFVHGRHRRRDRWCTELVREVDAVVNFAAESHVDRSILEPTAFLPTGVLGVHALLEAVRGGDRRAPSSPVRFLQVSTDEVYGPVPEGRHREDDPLDPQSPYSAAKAAGELLARAYRETYGLDVVITRGANTYGPRQYPEKLIPLFVTNASRTSRCRSTATGCSGATGCTSTTTRTGSRPCWTSGRARARPTTSPARAWSGPIGR